ncbi:CCDC25 family protein [Sporobolomyces koalae]|uniref:CCDC25 family protein n=1 Tax=Sporobolomyces koalae TaxID=500713 RepID=UPI0031805A93
MVLFYTSNVTGKDVTIYAGKDKFENEDLIKYATERDIWFHVDKLSSPHVYLKLPEGMAWESIPTELANDVGQLVKAGSIQGNKVACTILYTPASNLLKKGDYATGAVSFKNDRKVKRFHIAERINAVVNRLGKTKVEKQVDHEYEKIEREKLEARQKRQIANELKNQDLKLARERKAEAEARSYNNLHGKEGTDEWEDDAWNAKQKEGDFDPEDDFM